MIYDKAIEFFYKFGSVGRTTDDLKSNKPTEFQLNCAVNYAVEIKHQKQEDADLAKKAIKDHWGMK